MHHVAWTQNTEVLQALLENGADPNVKEEQGNLIVDFKNNWSTI